MGILLALLFWCAIASLSMPFGRDQGILAWSADTIRAGGLPFRDAWDVKGPLAPTLYAIAFMLFGRHETAVRALDLLMLGLAALIYVSLSKRWTGGWRAGMFAFCFFFFWTPRNFWDTAQPDLWAGVLVLAAGWCVCTRKLGVARSVSAGALVGLASLVKPPFAALIVGPASALLTSRAGRPRLVWLVAGLVLPVIACVAIFTARGALKDLIDLQVHFNLATHAARHSTSVAWFLRHGVGPFAGLRGLGMAGLIGVGLIALVRVDPIAVGSLAVNALVSCAIVVVQAKFYPYHFGPMIALAAPIAGLGASRLILAVRDAKRPLTALALAIPVCALLVFSTTQSLEAAQTTETWLSYQRGQITRQAYVDVLDQPYGFPSADIEDAAAFVEQHSAPTDRVYLFGFDALLYFEANRLSASRFGYSYPLVSGSWLDIASARHELIRSLQGGQAVMIVVQKNDANNLISESSAEALATFPELKDLIDTSYQPVRDNPSFTVYARVSR